MTEDEMVEYLAKKAVLWGLIYGRGLGNLPKDKFMQNYWDIVPNSLDNGKLGTGTLYAKPLTKIPQKVCTYRKPKLYWFGEVHGSNNYIWNEGFTSVRHWEVRPGMLYVDGSDPKNNLSVFVADTVEEYDPLKGKRFIGISEPDTSFNAVDDSFLKRFTGDEWVETETYNKKSSEWKPQGEIFISSGQPLRMNDRSKETIEQVGRIEFPEAH